MGGQNWYPSFLSSISTLRISRSRYCTLEKSPASLYPAFLFSQGGDTILGVSYNVNDGSEEKLFIAEAEARCASWGFLPVPISRLSPMMPVWQLEL